MGGILTTLGVVTALLVANALVMRGAGKHL